MSNPKNPPAFPSTLTPGMTLKQYYMAHIVQGAWARNQDFQLYLPEKIAEDASKIADALINLEEK